MPFLKTSDDVQLFYEETGKGHPLVFVHEFSGDSRSWEPQVREFSRRYRCITFNARGYPPSTVPEDPAKYSQQRATDDIREVMDHLGVERAHLVGLSMGGFAVLHFGIHYPGRASALTVAGAGFGAEPDKAAQFRAEVEKTARRFQTEGAAKFAPIYGSGPGREQYRIKDPRGFDEFLRQLGEHSSQGSALTLLGVQRRRPLLWELEEPLKRLRVPTLVITGDEDRPCLDSAIFLKKTIPAAGLAVFPKTGHTINLEEPALFNATVQRFLSTIENDGWWERDKQTEAREILLIEK